LLRAAPTTVPTLGKLPLDCFSTRDTFPPHPSLSLRRKSFLDETAYLSEESIVSHAQLRPAVHEWEFFGSTRKVFLPDLTGDATTFQDILEMVYQRNIWRTVHRLHATFSLLGLNLAKAEISAK
jgi:hypothetical protein